MLGLGVDLYHFNLFMCENSLTAMNEGKVINRAVIIRA